MATNHQTSKQTKQLSDVAVVMVPLPAHGHLNQLLHLSRRVAAHDIPVYYAAAATHLRQAKLRGGLHDPLSENAPIHFQEFPITHFENPQPNPHALTKFPSQIMPSLNASLSLRGPVFDFVDTLSKKFRRVIVIYDSLMAYVVQDLEGVPNVDCYQFRSISAFAICSWEIEISNDLPVEAEILSEIPMLDGYYPPEFGNFLNLQSGTKKIFKGEIYNSNIEIEGFCLDLLGKRSRNEAKSIWALGPFNSLIINEKRESNNGQHEYCLEWLDQQGLNSVIFVSFGTTCSFSDEQISEIALGLEKSGQKFIWVLRDADKGDIFTGDVRKADLPEGFENRVKDRGIIVRNWAPQLEILGHPSTGGFVSHCGWNSCLESISMGVPIATWPQHSDQPANSVLITKVLKIGVEMKQWSREDELLSSNRVENVVRKLMDSIEGDEIRNRASDLGEAVRNSVMDGGSCCKEMDSFITHITR